MMAALSYIARVMGVAEKTLERFVSAVSVSTGKTDVIEKLASRNEKIISETLAKINTAPVNSAQVRGALQKTVFYHEKQFLEFLADFKGADEFEKAARLARELVKTGRGFFLKKEFIKEILTRRRPDNLLRYLGYGSMQELFEKTDLTEAFSALRFVEPDEWMHQTFETAYSNFGPGDFEEREIEVKVLNPQWHDIARKFVAKKHHNVSHLKEFGVIFLNPIKMDIPGKFLRDFALLLHYFHEIDFYSKLFRKYSYGPDFSDRFKALLRGDVKELMALKEKNAWLIVQRYLAKENPRDPRLFQPRVNPESMHCTKGERDLAAISTLSGGRADLGMWLDLDWVGGMFAKNGGQEVVSFDLEDTAMSLVAFMEGRNEALTYHQREAMWTKIFAEYAGGEDRLEQIIINNFDQGYITL